MKGEHNGCSVAAEATLRRIHAAGKDDDMSPIEAILAAFKYMNKSYKVYPNITKLGVASAYTDIIFLLIFIILCFINSNNLTNYYLYFQNLNQKLNLYMTNFALENTYVLLC